MMAALRRHLENWWIPTQRVRDILEVDRATERESRVLEATRDAYHARKRAFEIEAELRRRTETACYDDRS